MKLQCVGFATINHAVVRCYTEINRCDSLQRELDMQRSRKNRMHRFKTFFLFVCVARDPLIEIINMSAINDT